MAARVTDTAYRRHRRRLVEQLRSSGIDDLAVLHAFDVVPRHLFVPEPIRHRAYDDAALPLGHRQTISRPIVHALHLSLAGLGGTERALEIGTGSGFQTALLSRLVSHVFSIEKIPELGDLARQRLRALGIENVTLRVGDGSAGWAEHAPYHVILVGAAAPRVPDSLKSQLTEGGRLLIPVASDGGQKLVLVTRTEDGFEEAAVEDARFVPLLGEEGW